MWQTMPLYNLVWLLFFAVEVHRGTKIHDSKKGEKETKKTLAVAPTDSRCTIGTKIENKAVNFNSLEKESRHYGENKKTIIIVGTVLEVQDFCCRKIRPWWRRHEGVHHQHPECKAPHSGTPSSFYWWWWLGEGCCYHHDYYWRHNHHISSICSIFWGDNTRTFEWWKIQSGGCTANVQNACPDALSIDRGWWVGGGGRFSPCDGCIDCGDASTSCTSLINSTYSNSSSSSTSSAITSHTGSVYSTATASFRCGKTYDQVTLNRWEIWLSWEKIVWGRLWC